MTVSQAIEQSIHQDEIVVLTEPTEGMYDELWGLADDSTGPMVQPDGAVLTEYWGTTDDGKEWRVHVLAAR